MPARYGPSTTCYNRFVRWRKAGFRDRLLAAVSAALEGEIVMINSTCVRVHQHGATGKKGGASGSSMGHSRGRPNCIDREAFSQNGDFTRVKRGSVEGEFELIIPDLGPKATLTLYASPAQAPERPEPSPHCSCRWRSSRSWGVAESERH
jgi:hypothetical protein